MNGTPIQQDAVPGTAVPTGALVSPGGAQGPQGIQGPYGVGPQGPPGPTGPEGMMIGTIFAWPSLTPPAGSLLCDGAQQNRNTYAALYAILGGASSPFGQGDGSTTFNTPNLLGRMILGSGQGSGLSLRNLGDTGGEENHILTLAESASHTHSISINDPKHLHTLPAHGHTFSDPGHNHGDPGHNHGLNDPQHSHTISWTTNCTATSNLGRVQSGAAGAGGLIQNSGTGCYNSASGTGIQAAGTGCTVANAAAINVNSVATGITASATSVGSGAGHNNMSPFLVLTYCIKASNPVPVGPTVPLADTTQAGLLNKVSGLTTDYIGGDNACHDLVGQIKLVAPFVRSFNSLHNPNFEVDSRTAGAGQAGNGTWGLDRWQWFISTGSGGAVFTGKQTAAPSGIVLPGAAFSLSSKFYRITLTTQQVTLGATDRAYLQQSVEGIALRELIAGNTAITVVLRSSVPNITLGLHLQDAAGTNSLTLPVALTTANTWTVVPLSNIAPWNPSATWSLLPGTVGYVLGLCLFSGPTFMAAANNVWAPGNFKGAAGQSNFAASPAGSTIDIAFIQHEPGNTAGSIIDKAWIENRNDCFRYYYKSYEDATAVATNTTAGEKWMHSFAAGYGFGSIPFPVQMAKVPAVTIYNNNGTVNQATSFPGGVSYAVTSTEVTSKSLDYIVMTSSIASQSYRFQFVADTGW